MTCVLSFDLALNGSTLLLDVLVDGVSQGTVPLDLSSLANGTTDVCAALQGLPSLDIDDDPATLITIDENGECVRATPEQLNPCLPLGPSGQTAQRDGAWLSACVPLPMPAGGDPKTQYPPATYPLRWKQAFEGPNTITGLTETWQIELDTNGDNQWHQVA